MSKPSPILLRSAGAAAFVAAAMAGWHLTGANQPASATAEAGKTPGKELKRGERALRNGGMPAHVRDTLAAIRNAGSPDQRMRATIDLATNMPVGDLAEWLEKRWFDTGEGFDLTLFNKIAMQRWEAEDREGLIAWSLKNNPSRASQLLAALAKEDPAKALAFFADHPNPGMEIQMLSSVARTDPKLALGHLKQMIEGGTALRSGDYMSDSLFLEIAKKDPAALEAELDSLPGNFRFRAELALAGERLKASFSEGLQELTGRPDGLKLFKGIVDRDDALKDQLFDKFADLPDSWKRGIGNEAHRYVSQENAAKWLAADLESMGINDKQAQNIRYMAIQYQASKEPGEALKALGNLELDKQQRQSLISMIFGNAAQNPEKVEQLMNSLESEEDRETAQMTAKANQESSSPDSQLSEPKDWLEKISSINPDRSFGYLHMLSQWPKEKMAALSDEFRAMPDDKKLPVAKLLSSSYYSNEIDQTLQGDAIRYLVNQPPAPKTEEPEPGNQGPVGRSQQINLPEVASRHAVFLANKDPEAAVQWVQTLPGGEAKQWAQKNLAANWAKYDPDAVQQWVSSLPTADRKQVESYLESKRQ
jgi:hypothetical protein